jgi:hypothetical protein
MARLRALSYICVLVLATPYGPALRGIVKFLTKPGDALQQRKNQKRLDNLTYTMYLIYKIAKRREQQ